MWVRGKNFVVTCTRALMRVARCIYGNCFVGKYFVVCFSTTKFLPPKNTSYTVYTVTFSAHALRGSIIPCIIINSYTSRNFEIISIFFGCMLASTDKLCPRSLRSRLSALGSSGRRFEEGSHLCFTYLKKQKLLCGMKAIE